MKKLLLLLLIGFTFCACWKKDMTDSTKPYYFSKDLKKAISKCTPYTEDLFAKNPEMKEKASSAITMFFDNIDTSSMKLLFEVQGKNEDKCQINIKYDYQITTQEFNCALPSEEQKKLLDAMNDTSTEIKTKTIDSGFVSSTITGYEFDFALPEITNDFCQPVEQQPLSEEEKMIAAKQLMAFSDQFKASLQACTPDKDSIKVMGMKIAEVEIKGKEEDKCHVVSQGFNILLNDDELSMSSFDELAELLSDENRATYRPVYQYRGTLFALSECDYAKNNGQSAGTGSGESMSSSIGEDIQISKGIKNSYENGLCKITSSLQMTRNGKTTDYSLLCELNNNQLAQYMQPYSDLIQEYGPKISENSFSSGRQNKEVTKADRDLFLKMYRAKLCKKAI